MPFLAIAMRENDANGREAGFWRTKVLGRPSTSSLAITGTVKGTCAPYRLLEWARLATIYIMRSCAPSLSREASRLDMTPCLERRIAQPLFLEKAVH